MVLEDWVTVCRIGNGQTTVSIEPSAVIGPYAVHPRLVYGQAVGPGWVVTHRAVGLMVWVVSEFEEATRVAEWLVKERILPEDRNELMRWKTTLTQTEYTDLIVKLQSIAPRFQPPMANFLP